MSLVFEVALISILMRMRNPTLTAALARAAELLQKAKGYIHMQDKA